MKKGSIKGLIPLIVFLLIFAGTGIITGKFENMPLLVAFIITSAIALAMNKEGEKLSLSEKVDMFAKGGGDPTLILMVLIFILAGAFYSVADAMGAVSSTVNLGLSILPANMLLPGLFIVGCVLSFAMGTSMGTVSALTPIAVGIASNTNISMPLICGVVIGGAMFGDNLSFISDTTIAATRTQEVEMRDKFKVNILIVLPAVIINLIVLFFMNVKVTGLETFEYNLVNIIPYIVIIAFALMGLNVFATLGLGILVGCIIGLIHGDFTVLEMFEVLQRGMGWMEDIAIIAIVVGGVVALMNHYGGIDYLIYKLTSKVKTKKGAEFSMAALVSLIDVATTNNTISIITAGPIARDISDQFEIDRRRTAGLLDIFSSGFQGLIPYGGQLLVAGGLAQISPGAITPYSWYPMLIIVMGIIAIITGIPKLKEVKK
ncbi:MAG: Na+/H+ antiporter NhaC family protein [Tissierellia bacterium]|nr:Na+/H+ antiporter NhaC family protein [Tissierellia bacterium]